MDTPNELLSQWRNPSDILSLLLLIGGDVIQKAIVQLFGVYVQPLKHFPRLYLTPVAFSFGWVGYAFISLASVIGDKQLAPPNPDNRSIVINCGTGYIRNNCSWLLGRILRDCELAAQANPGPEAAKLDNAQNKGAASPLENNIPPRISLRIDIFELDGEARISIDRVWVIGWAIIIIQLGISIIPWGLHGHWSIFLITGAGTLLALLTGSLRQWNLEKWPGRRLNLPVTSSKNEKRQPKASSLLSPTMLAPLSAEGNSNMERGQAGLPTTSQPSFTLSPLEGLLSVPEPRPVKKSKTKTVCLTGGNGHRYALILIGSGSSWDLEALGTATSDSLRETPLCLLILAVLWMCLLVSVAGIQSDTWYLLGIGGLGMLQNLYAASAPRRPESLGLAMRPYAERPTIIGAAVDEKQFWHQPGATESSDDESVSPNDPLVREKPYLEPWETVGVRGAIRELEKTIPKAGVALMPEFFPAIWKIERERYRDNKELRFWRWMFKRPTKEDR